MAAVQGRKEIYTSKKTSMRVPGYKKNRDDAGGAWSIEVYKILEGISSLRGIGRISHTGRISRICEGYRLVPGIDAGQWTEWTEWTEWTC